MHADVAFANGAKDGIRQRMHGGVGVRVALERVGVRNLHTTESDDLSLGELVKVDALTHA